MTPMESTIERVDVFGVAVPQIAEYKFSRHAQSVQRSAIVRVTARSGAVGLGNIDPTPGYSEETVEQSMHALSHQLAPLVVGADATNIHRVLQLIEPALPGYLDAKAGIEMACVDLAARLRGISVHTYLGGAVKDVLRFNAWIGMLSPDEAAKETVALQTRGFRSAKIKVGHNIEADRDRVKAVREAVGPAFALRIDANAYYDVETSIKLAHMMIPYDLQLFEQPTPANDLAGLARVRRESGGIPIMADESVLDHASLLRIIRMGAADMVKVKVMKQGGLLNTRRMIATAEAAGMRCVLGHGFGLSINTMAEIMLAATTDAVIDGIECVGPLKMADDVVMEKLDLSTGSLPLPQGPGLGLALDEVKLHRYRFDAGSPR